MSAASAALAAPKEKHPKGLYVLFFAEAWERFSYYGMRALLVLYLTKYLAMPEKSALFIYGLYTGLVYLTPILGGYLADQVLGKRKAVIIGGTVMALGHLAMAFESLLYPALGLLIIGNGFFKPNISTIVGGLYREGDPRRDGGFTIFYMGINLGAFFSPLVCGSLGESKAFGWHYGFGAAGVGMIIGLGVFLAGQRLLGSVGFPPGVKATADTRLTTRDFIDVVIWVIGCCLLVAGVIKFVIPAWGLVAWPVKLGIGVTLLLGQHFLRKALSKEKAGKAEVEPFTSKDWARIAVICILCVFVINFWMGFEQAGGTMTIFADQQTDRHLFGWEIPASFFQSINPLGIFLMAPLFSMLWYRIDNSKYPLSTPLKFSLGLVFLGLGFVVMFIGQGIATKTGSVGPLWLTVVYLLHTIGELCLSPIGLSMVTKLSPVRIVSLMMGIWFISSAVANYLAGTLKGILDGYDIPIYGFLVGSSFGAAVLLVILNPFLKKWTHGAEEIKSAPPEPPTRVQGAAAAADSAE